MWFSNLQVVFFKKAELFVQKPKKILEKIIDHDEYLFYKQKAKHLLLQIEQKESKVKFLKFLNFHFLQLI